MKAQVLIEVRNAAEELVAVTDRFLRCLIRAPFGAERARLWVNFVPEDVGLPLEHGHEVTVIVDDAVRFRGRVYDIRTDTAGTPLGFRAVRDLRVAVTERVNASFQQQTPTSILQQVIGNLDGAPIAYTPNPVSSVVVDRLDFAQAPLFHVVDVLAKLAGNWLWDVDWDGNLRFRPHEPDLSPDHVLYYDDRYHEFTIWETQRFIQNVFKFHGGVVGGNAFERGFLDDTSVGRYGARNNNLYVRAITTDGAFGLLRDAVLAQLPHPANEKYLTLHNHPHHIGPGDTIELRETGLRPLDDDSIFRVAEQEIRVDNSGVMRVRLTLAQKWESSRLYYSYIDHDYFADPLNYVSRRVGPFELDWSALDSSAALG